MPKLREMRHRFLAVVLQHILYAFVIAGETGVRAIAEDEAIKHTVEQVAKGARKYERAADKQPLAITFIDQPLEQVKPENNRGKPEGRQGNLTRHRFAQLHAISHAFIFNKVQPEPTTHHRHLIAVGEVSFDINFQYLVSDNYEQDYQ